MRPKPTPRQSIYGDTGVRGAVSTALLLLCVALIFAAAPRAFAAESAGTILMLKGDVEAEAADGTARVLAKGEDVSQGDTIKTAPKSFAVINFSDGGKVTVRPGTVLVIDEYAYGGDNDGAALKLVKGGLRALTGAIAKQNPDAYRVNTPVATLGVRGTEFDVRWCEGEECAREEELLKEEEGAEAEATPAQ